MSILNFPTSLMEELENEVLLTEYPEFNFAELVPVRQVSPDVETIAHLTLDYVGASAAVIGVAGENIPKVDFKLSKDSTNVWDMGFSFDITQSDIRASSRISAPNIDLIRDKLVAADFIYRKSLQDLVINGLPQYDNVNGLANSTDIPSSPAPKVLDNTATAQEMVNTLTSGITAVRRQTLNTRNPDTCIMPSRLFDLIAQTRFDGGLGISVLQAFQDSARAILGRDLILRVNDNFGTDVLFYQFSDQNLRMHSAQTLTYFPEERRGTAFERTAFYRFGGVQLRNFQAFHKITGIVAEVTT